MKSFKKYIFVGIMAYMGMSCNYLDVVPDNIATIDHAFSDRYTAETFLATCYWGLPKVSGLNETPAWFASGEMTINKELVSSYSGMRFALGYNNATEALINYWGANGTYVRSLYAGINDCNTFLENIREVRDLDSYEKERWTAEVKLIKAYMHFFLITYYGPICPLRENIPINESIRGVRVYREKIDDCFGYVFELIDEVIESNALPRILDNRATELGRFTQVAAYMLKAKALMYWASPLFNGNTEYNNFLDHNGEHFFNQTYDPERWQLAADACKEAIDICQVSGIRLYRTSDYVTAKPMSDSTRIVNVMRSVISERWNCELIWGNTSAPAGSNLQRNCFTRLESGTGDVPVTGVISVPLHMVDKFYSKNGVPIDEDANYDYANRFDVRTGDADHRFYIEEGQQSAAMNFDREPRFYSTLGFDRGKWYGNSYKGEPEDDSQALFLQNRFGEYSSVLHPLDYNATGYFPKKLVAMNTVFRDANAVSWESYPYPEMRYADLLLFYAEALNEIKAAPDNEVWDLVDEVRRRAGLEGVVDSWRKYARTEFKSKPSDQAGMREIIQRERAIEFACEGAYYWDSHRWKTAMREQNRLIQGWNVQGAVTEDYYSVTALHTMKFTHRDYFAPIPEADIIRNPLLIQNPGW